ncbi:MAG: nucleotidyl transferase AbiEii/AbiGii toxin family protein [Candidatus Shapirobacteria bacterium]|jgi:predicted nucleotidyltransferase component of viral defense system|nr:nucleotidyl transferase AbiEii/AbiGii toxin family protein [Candidatus Shapirobacteria bacterium]
MITLRPADAIHKAYLLRTLSEIIDNPVLSDGLYFKGGTCASMMGILDRFSVDLDFDLKIGVTEKQLRVEFYKIFNKLGFNLYQESKKALEFFLKYKNSPNERNTLKIDALNFVVKSNKYLPVFLPEINRTVNCQTQESIFANKMVAVKDRYDRKKAIAGRDIYDIHYFFLKKLKYSPEIIIERTGMKTKDYLIYLRDFIKEKVGQTLIDQDLNTLLPVETFNKIRKTLKDETVMFLDNEISNL